MLVTANHMQRRAARQQVPSVIVECRIAPEAAIGLGIDSARCPSSADIRQTGHGQPHNSKESESMRYCFVFVCQHGELEIKSLLLAASLKRHLQCDHELVAAIPEPSSVWGNPTDLTIGLLTEMGVRTTHITNGINIDYPIGNKVSCLDIPTDADKLVFLDSDILCTRDFQDHDRFRVPFNAKPADVATFSTDIHTWDRIYAKFGLRTPGLRMITTVTQELTVPYFNAGVIAVDRKIGLGREWLEICREIDLDPSIKNKRPWLDQVALPVTVAKMGVKYDCLGEEYNFPLNLRPIRNSVLPYFCHYHNPAFIRHEPSVNRLVLELLDAYPAIAELLSSSNAWVPLTRPFKLAPSAPRARSLPRAPTGTPTPDGIITGIPRSGTSYLCALLNKVKNCVAVNEPAEIFPILQNQIVPYGMAVYYRSVRGRILDGLPIDNKLLNGAPIEDTWVVDRREQHLPEVYSADFALFTKNTLAYSSRLKELKRVMPQAPIIACVRNPYDTIASWKTSFPHLRDADVTKLPLGGMNDPFLTGVDRYLLMRIASTGNETVRRALLWRYLAERIVAQKDILAIMRYEAIVTDPGTAIAFILGALPASPGEYQIPALEKSAIRSKRHALSNDDVMAISALCQDIAHELGYDKNMDYA